MFLLLIICFGMITSQAMLVSKAKPKPVKATSSGLQKRFFTENEKNHIRQLIKANRFTCINNFLKVNKTLTAQEKLFLHNELAIKKQTITKALASHQQLVADLKINTTVGIIGAGAFIPASALTILETTAGLVEFASDNNWTNLIAASHIALTGGAVTYLAANAATRCLKTVPETLLDERYIPIGKYTLQRHCADIEDLTLILNALKVDTPIQAHIDTGC